MQKVKTSKVEIKLKEMQDRVEHLNDRHKIMSANLKKIFGVWDTFFKTIGVVFSVVIAGAITYATRGLYYTNGKWDFSLVVLGALIFVVVVALMIWLTWKLINDLLISKIRSCLL